MIATDISYVTCVNILINQRFTSWPICSFRQTHRWPSVTRFTWQPSFIRTSYINGSEQVVLRKRMRLSWDQRYNKRRGILEFEVWSMDVNQKKTNLFVKYSDKLLIFYDRPTTFQIFLKEKLLIAIKHIYTYRLRIPASYEMHLIFNITYWSCIYNLLKNLEMTRMENFKDLPKSKKSRNL